MGFPGRASPIDSCGELERRMLYLSMRKASLHYETKNVTARRTGDLERSHDHEERLPGLPPIESMVPANFSGGSEKVSGTISPSENAMRAVPAFNHRSASIKSGWC